MPQRETTSRDHALAGKASFDDIYDRADPRAYFQTLRPLGYQIPHHGQQLFRALLNARGRSTARDTVVDLCCSYGINSALLNHELTLEDLYAHYSRNEPATGDHAFFAARRRPDAHRAVGIDVATAAIAYARRVGLLDEGFAENLEEAEPSAALRNAVADATLITVTGGVGYITHRTFDRVLDGVSNTPWVAALVLREVPYQPIADTLAQHGLVTEQLTTRTFPQRRFASAEESLSTLEGLARLGISTVGKEDAGYYHTNLYVSRPARDVRRIPLESLLSQ